ncbi:glycosyl hydrolase family 85-domain-containing protein [Coprinopsis sp. MPI-PUGE-AT-0042]|nr:glycosyl hydrolase family 85-domain-containing protein [Coprinopsis sp. MPI-PUGE-AT-0042]
MPITGTRHPPRLHAEHFESFREFDEWRFSQAPGSSLPGEGGGYSDSLFEKSYTFNWWHSASLFNYFAHHRISIPPSEWITSAHRQGVPILGTMYNAADLYQMVAGKPFPGDREYRMPTNDMPVSSHYAKLLANLARERGFDGWLVNIEIDMSGGRTEARGLAAWLTIFQREVLMYDSVIIRGDLVWQERVNSRNLPFFLGSSGLFTNYEWRNNFPEREVEYMKTLDAKYMTRNQYHSGNNLQDIYTGVDVFGRQSHGDGGFGAYKAIEHLDPQGPVGLSVALFAPGWTWEPTVNNLGWDWAQWWQYDTKLWVGPPSGTVEVLQHHYKPNELRPGVGNHWFAQGKRVFTSKQGWMDVDKQTSIGDLVWPRPSIHGDSGQELESAITSSSFIFEDAWNGGNSLQLHASLPDGHSLFWLPIQSLSLTSRVRYEASIVFKCPYAERTTIVFEVLSESTSSIVPSAIGFTISPTLPRSSNAIELKFLVGEISVYPHLPPEYQDFKTSLFWLTFLATSINSTILEGTLEWEVGATLPHTRTPMPVQPTNQKWLPEFRYFNWRGSLGDGLSQMEATWIGTTGYGGHKDRFFVLEENMRAIVGSGRVAFQIEGVLETGEVIRWNGHNHAPFSTISREPTKEAQAHPQESADKSHTVLS